MNTAKMRKATARRTRKTDLAFTLLELMIAVAVIGILVAIVIFVFFGEDRKADHAVAVDNLMTGARVVDAQWYAHLGDQAGCQIPGGTYRDYDPPEILRNSAFFQANGYWPCDARYLSEKERMINWVDLSVGGTSPPVAAADVGPFLATDGYGFEIQGVWRGGSQIGGAANPGDSSALPGKIGVVQNKYWWDGAWQDNTVGQYVTLVTLEKISGLAHFYTMNVGVTVAGGTFEWKNGDGTPGASFGDELADQPPSSDNPPADNPPGDVTPPSDNPPPDVTPPADNPPPDVTPPATDVTPPATNAPTPPATDTPPGVQPPSGPNMASSIKIEPDTLNLSSNGVFSVFISFASGYDPANINAGSLVCYGAAGRNVKYPGGWEIQLKFDRGDLTGVPTGSHVLILVTGTFKDGSAFQGWDYINVMN